MIFYTIAQVALVSKRDTLMLNSVDISYYTYQRGAWPDFRTVAQVDQVLKRVARVDQQVEKIHMAFC